MLDTISKTNRECVNEMQKDKERGVREREEEEKSDRALMQGTSIRKHSCNNI